MPTRKHDTFMLEDNHKKPTYQRTDAIAMGDVNNPTPVGRFAVAGGRGTTHLAVNIHNRCCHWGRGSTPAHFITHHLHSDL